MNNVLIQWCLKGIPETDTFGDAEAENALTTVGLTSNWIRKNAAQGLVTSLVAAHQALSDAALAAHVNAY